MVMACHGWGGGGSWVAVVLLIVGHHGSWVWWSWVHRGVGSHGVVGSHGWQWVELVLAGLG